MYSYLYRLIQKIILKRSFNTDLIKLINSQKPKYILDIGCADSTLLENLEETYNYNGYDLDNSFVNKSKNKYSHKKNFHFYNKSVDEIDFQNKGEYWNLPQQFYQTFQESPEFNLPIETNSFITG